MTVNLDELADEVLRSTTAEAPSLDAVVSRAAIRRRQRRITAGVGALCLAIVVAAGGWWSLAQIENDQDVIDTVDQPEDREGGLDAIDPAQRGSFIWPFPAQGIESARQLVDRFAAEVLGWAAGDYDYDYEESMDSQFSLETATEPLAVNVTNAQTTYEVTIVAMPSSVGWGIVQIDSGDGTDIIGLSEGIPFNVDVHLGLPADDPVLRAIVNLADGSVLDTALVRAGEGPDYAGYTVAESVESITAFEEIVSILLTVESAGEVVAVTGGQFNPGDEQEMEAVEVPAEDAEHGEQGSDAALAAQVLAQELAEAEAGKPSQSAEDAVRDGVVPELAKLPLSVRIDLLQATGSSVTAETQEGLWLISRPREVRATDCIVGDRRGRYGADFICTVDYTEIVLLGPDHRSIVKAYPMPSLNVHELYVTDDAIFCRRLGDGGGPDSILCRIDRVTGEMTVRVFPYPAALGGDPTAWLSEIATPFAVAVGREMDHIGGTLDFDGSVLRTTDPTVEGSTAELTFDPLTLELLSVGGN